LKERLIRRAGSRGIVRVTALAGRGRGQGGDNPRKAGNPTASERAYQRGYGSPARALALAAAGKRRLGFASLTTSARTAEIGGGGAVEQTNSGRAHPHPT